MRSLYIARTLGKPMFSAPLRVIAGGVASKPPARRVPKRGVREADYLLDGCRVFEAIDSKGNCVKRAKLEPDVIEEVPREWLWGYLERVDPRPQLRRATAHR